MAKKKISELPAGGALNGTELVPIVQTGTTKRITAQDIANLGNASGVEGSGTINYLSKFTATSTIGNSQFFDNGTSIGLGTATPNASYKLDIVGNLRATTIVKLGGTSAEYLKADGSVSTLTNPITGTGTTNYLPKFTGASALGNSNLINDANGQLGLGTTPSAWDATLVRAFQIGNLGASISSYTALNTSTPFMFVDNNAYYDGTNDKYILNRAAARYVQVAGEHQWLTAPTGTAGNAITFTQAMTLDASGRLGIGTTSPLAILDVFQTGQPQLRVRGTAGANHLYQDSITGTSNSDGLFVGIGSDQIGYIFQYEAKDLVFGTNTTERMRITSAGNVGIGGTPNYMKFEVIGATSAKRLGIGTNVYYTNSMDILALSDIGADIPLGISGETINLYTAATERMRITSAGNVGIGTTSPTRKLTVQGDDDGTMQLRLQGTASTTSYWELGRESQSSGQFRIIASRTGTVITPLAIGDVTGNVMINTTTDAGYKLDVNGTARVSGTLNANSALSDTIGTFALAMNGNYTGLRTGTDGSFNVDVYKSGTGYINPFKISPSGAATFSSSVGVGNFTTTQINALTPAAGMVVFNTTLATLCFYDGSGWRKVSHSSM